MANGFDVYEEYRKKKGLTTSVKRNPVTLTTPELVYRKPEQSNNTPSVSKQTGNALDVAKQVIAKQQPTRQMGVGFNKPQTIPQNPYAKKVAALPYNPNALQKAQQIGQQAQGKTAQQIRQQNLANIKAEGQRFVDNSNKVLERGDALLKSNNWMGKISATGDALINNAVKSAQERVATYENAPAVGTLEYLEWIKNRGRITDPTIDKLIVQAAEKFDIDPTQYSPATQEFLKDEQEAREKLMDGLTGGKKTAAEVAVALGDVVQNKMIEATTGVPYKAVMAATGGAEAMQRKLSEGKSAADAGWYGLGSAGISAGVESLGGIGGGIAGTTIGQRIMKVLPEKLATQLFNLANSALARLGISAGSESFEEAAEYVAQWAWESLMEGKVMPFSWDELKQNAKIGGLTGGVFEGINIAVNGKPQLNPEDYITEDDYRADRGENESAARMAGRLDSVYGAENAKNPNAQSAKTATESVLQQGQQTTGNNVEKPVEANIEAANTTPQNFGNPIAEMGETSYNKDGGAANGILDNGSSQRNVGESPRGQAGRVDQDTGSNQKWNLQAERARRLGVRAGVQEGLWHRVTTPTSSGAEYTADLMDESLVAENEHLVKLRETAAKSGVSVTYCLGEFSYKKGSTVHNNIRAMNLGNGQYIISATTPIPPDLLFLHEWYHDIVARTKINGVSQVFENTKKKLLDTIGYPELMRRAEYYKQSYAGMGLKGDEIIEEMIADSYAGINNTDLTQTVFSLADAYESAVSSSGEKFSVRSAKHDVEDGEMYNSLIDSGVFTPDEADSFIAGVNGLIDKITALGPNRKDLDMWESEGKEDRAFSPFKPNSDPLYKWSLDFSTLCKKRIVTQAIIERLNVEAGKALDTNTQFAIAEKLRQMQDQYKNLQVACAICYVESARLKSPKVINDFLANRRLAMVTQYAKDSAENRAAATEAMNAVKAKYGFGPEASKADVKKKFGTKAVNEISNASKQTRESYQPTAEQEEMIRIAEEMPAEIFLTSDGLTELAKKFPEVYKAFTSKVRSATRSKSLESGVAYYWGDSYEAVPDSLIQEMNKENGLRHQSWSDFEMVHLLDEITAIAELATRHAKMHTYTKVPEMVEVIGDTGIMINLSLIPKGHTGLDANGNLDFSSTEGMDKVTADHLRKVYHKTAGNIAIGVSDEQIDKLLADDTIDYVIPYHVSGLSKQLRKIAQIHKWKNYTDTQNETKLKGIPRAGQTDWHKKPNFSDWFTPDIYESGKTGIEIMREAAEKYKAICKERGLKPKFYDRFGKDPNYWKLLVDRKMIDGDGNIIIQQEVKPKFNWKRIGDLIDQTEDPHMNELIDEVSAEVKKAMESGEIAAIAKNSKAVKKAQQMLGQMDSEDYLSVDISTKQPIGERFSIAVPGTNERIAPNYMPWQEKPVQTALPYNPNAPKPIPYAERKQLPPGPNYGNMGIVANPDAVARAQARREFFTPTPNPEGSRRFDGSVLDNLGQGEASFDSLNALLAQSKEDAAKKPPAKEGVAQVLTERPKRSKRETFEGAKDWMNRKLIDSGNTINTIAKAAGDDGLYPMYDSAKKARQAAENMIGEEQTDINGNSVGESLVSIFEPIKAKGEEYFRDFSTYLYHVHNVDRMSLETNGAQIYQDAIMQLEMENPMLQNATREEVEALASGNSDYREVAIEWLQLDDSLNNLRNKPVFGDSVTAEDSRKAAAELQRKNPEFAALAERVYAYNRNLMKYRVDAGLVSQKQADIMNALYPHYVPTFRDTSSTKGMQIGGNSAKVAQTVKSATGSNLDLMPIDGSMAEQTLQTVRAAKMNLFGARLLEVALKNQDKVGKHIRGVVDKYNSYDMDEPPNYTGDITIYVGGKPVSMDADAGVMEAFQSLQPDRFEGNIVYDKIVEANNTFKVLVTSANPVFLVRNFARDLQDAGLYTGDLKEFAKHYPKAWKEIKNNGELWRLYKAMGGTGSSYFDYEKGLMNNERTGFGKVIDKIEFANLAVEQAPRFTEFMAVLEKEGRTYEGIQKAMLAAAEVTTNFGRSGTAVKFLNKSFVPFLNPSIQGADKFVRQFAEAKGAKEWLALVGRCALLGIGPALLNELLHRGTEEEEEYAMLNDRDKETNYVFRFGDGYWVKIPKGRAVSVFGSAAQRTARMLKGEEDAWNGFIDLALDQVGYVDPFTNNILMQAYNTKLFDKDDPGETWYGSDIEPQRLQSLPAGERYDEKTDALSKWLGGALGISPKKINYLLGSYTGVIGDFGLPMITPQAERNPIAKAFSIDSVTSNKLSSEFYSKLDELEQDKNSSNPSDGVDLAYSYLNGVSREVSELNKQIRAIEADETIENKDKRERTRKLATERNNLIKEALEVLPQYTEHAASYKGDPDDAKREVNRKQFGAEYALKKYDKDIYAKAQKANKSLISYESFYDAYFAQKDVKGDKDANGKTIDLSASGNKKLAIDKATPNLTQKQREVLYEMFNVSKDVWNGYLPKRK